MGRSFEKTSGKLLGSQEKQEQEWYTVTMNNPTVKLWLVFAISIVLIGLALFLCAGTITYWQAWIYLGVVGVSSALLTLSITKDPVLLEGRTTLGPSAEQRPIQRVIVVATGVPALAAFILPGLDHRFGWSSVPFWLSIVGDLFIAVSLWLVYLVFKENSFGASTVEIVKDQKVISTGPLCSGTKPNVCVCCAILCGHGFRTWLLLGSHPGRSHHSWPGLEIV